VPVYAVDSDWRSLAFVSRYCRQGFLWNFEAATSAQSAEFLTKLGRRIGGKPILIPTTDAAVLLVARNASALSEKFTFPRISYELAHALCSKKQMHFLAKRLGVPAPNTFFPYSVDDVVRFGEQAVFPVIIKPIEADQAKTEAARAKTIVHGKKELIQMYWRMENPERPNLMLQEYIPGGEEQNWMFNGYFDENSMCLFGMTGRKIRQHRPYAGITSLGVCEPNPAVAETTVRFMAAIGYRGSLDIGYRYDARDGQYKVFDVNPRIGCTFRLFVSSTGTDVARAMYLHLCGESVPAGAPQVGRKWVVEDLDLASSFHYWREGKLSLRKWLASFKGVREGALFARDDLKPIFRVLMNDLRLLIGSEEPGKPRQPRGPTEEWLSLATALEPERE
jgi:D-aspartate ligase